MNLVEEKRKNNLHKQKIHKLVKKAKTFNFKNLVNKVHKLIVKDLKLNVNCHI